MKNLYVLYSRYYYFYKIVVYYQRHFRFHNTLQLCQITELVLGHNLFYN